MRSRVALVVVGALLASGRVAAACDSTACAVAMRYAEGPLLSGHWRLEASLRYVDQGRRLTGRDATAEVLRPRVDLETGTFESAAHRETGESMTFLTLELTRGLPAYIHVNESQLGPRITLTAGFVKAF